MQDGVRVFDLAVARGQTAFMPGFQTATIGINQSYLGPILGFVRGETVRLNVTNALDEAMTLHWHGLSLPAAMDGGPHQVIRPGATWSPEFVVDQEASTFWYHGHMMGKTGEHVWAGMAGVIHFADPAAPDLGLPSTHGVDDFTLVLQDRSFTADGQMPYAPNMHHRMAGYSGDRPLVNGTLDAAIEVPAGQVRLRLLNGSNGSIYGLAFADGRSFVQIGSDGGLLPAPVTLTQMLLAPGERAELLADFSDGAPAMLTAQAFGSEAAMMGANGSFDFAEFRPVAGKPLPVVALPPTLADLGVPDPAASTGRRELVLASQMAMGMGMSFSINGVQMDPARIDFTVPRGSTETWVLRNQTTMLHPIHIHDTQFRILGRNGKPPAPGEAGLKDTVLVGPNEVVEVQCRFGAHADATLPYMYHCHILEHEDAGMMGQFTVV